MSAPLVTMEWRHPGHGNIVETVCRLHEGRVLGALHLLGIGSGARYARPDEGGCSRCAHDGARTRTWLPALAGRPDLLAEPEAGVV